MNSKTVSLKVTIWYFLIKCSLGQQRDPNEWRLFIDSSNVTLKAAILRNGKKFPSVPQAPAANMKESYENIKLFLEKIQNEKYSWNICGNLNVIALLLGLHKVLFLSVRGR